MANQGMGEVIAFDRSNLPAVRKEDYVEAIQLWCETRNTAEVLTREEIGSMQAFDRIDAQRKALILSFAHYLREHPRSDVALGVQLVLTLLSDNEKGISSISQPTLAKLFNRSVSSIADAQRRLKDKGLIVTGRGRYAGTTPVIPRVVTQHKNHLTWLIDAICNQDKTSNHPARPVDCQSSGQTGGLKRIEHQSTGPTGGLKKLNHPVEGNSIIRPDPMQLHYKNSTVVDRAARVVAAGIATAMGALPAAAHPHDPPAVHQPSQNSIHDLADRLFAAAGNVMNRTNPMIEVMTLPRKWIEEGCDLEKDILPTIRAMASRKPDQSVSTWKFFERAVAEAKAAREAPMAQGDPPQSEVKRKPTIQGNYSFSGEYIGPRL